MHVADYNSQKNTSIGFSTFGVKFASFYPVITFSNAILSIFFRREVFDQK